MHKKYKAFIPQNDLHIEEKTFRNIFIKFNKKELFSSYIPYNIKRFFVQFSFLRKL